jgi:hypothetical protein
MAPVAVAEAEATGAEFCANKCSEKGARLGTRPLQSKCASGGSTGGMSVRFDF